MNHCYECMLNNAYIVNIQISKPNMHIM